MLTQPAAPPQYLRTFPCGSASGSKASLSNMLHCIRLSAAPCLQPLQIGTLVPGMAIHSGIMPSHITASMKACADDDPTLLRSTLQSCECLEGLVY